MSVQPVSFGYSHKLKTLYKQGKLPTVLKGFYGDVLTKDVISLEHLKPHSKGGKTVLNNLVLSSVRNNNKRGNKPLKDFLNPETMKEYLNQFKGLKVGNFNGDKYIESITKTVKELINA